jgi:hypothetical protein
MDQQIGIIHERWTISNPPNIRRPQDWPIHNRDNGDSEKEPNSGGHHVREDGRRHFFLKVNKHTQKQKKNKNKKHGLPARSTARLDLPRVPPRGVRLEGRVLQMRQVATASSSYHPRRRRTRRPPRNASCASTPRSTPSC